MNRFGLIATLAVLALAPALAHAAQMVDPVVPSALPESSLPPPTELGGAVPPRLRQNEMRGMRDADARHCLDLPTNRQVHRCAERYRSRVARARAASVKAAAAAPKGAETAVVAPAAKPAEMARPSDAPKGTIMIKPMESSKATPSPAPAPAAPPQAAPKAAQAPPKTTDVIKPAPPAEPTKK